MAVECGPNLKSVDSWAFYCRYNYNAVSSVTVNANEGSLDSVLNNSYAFRAAGLTYTQVDIDNICSVASLQKAIDLSEGPSTLTLSQVLSDVNQSIIIPAGKDITLVDNGTSVGIDALYNFSKPLFIINEGGKLTIDATSDENMIINGAVLSALGRLTAGVFQVNGELVLNGGTINGGGNLGDNKAINGMFSGAIVLGDSAKFTMTGGTLRGTSTDGAHSAPVIVGSGAVFSMSGGAIADNYNATKWGDGYAAGAVLVYGWNNSDVGGKMILSDAAEISGNRTSGVGGAVTLVGNAELYMNGGVITGNQSVGGEDRNGGGVCVAGRTGGMSPTYDAKCVFTMDGGEISNNSAQYGGGIYVNSNYVTLNAGEISGNKARMVGGGVYVETPHSNSTGLHMSSALITGNTASVMGGGMYFCPTGSGSLYVNEGAAIFDNTAGGAADDFVSVVSTMFGAGKAAILAERMLGGGLAQWYRDGSVTETAMNGGWGYIAPDSVRYNASNPISVAAGTYGDNLALKAVVTELAKEVAKENAALVISGNSAERGGGIGANGSLTAGNPPSSEYPEYSLKVNKVWSGVPESQWEPVTIQLMLNGHGLDTVVLNAENNWTASFTHLPESVVGRVSVLEIAPTGYDDSYSAPVINGNEISITVTNAIPQTYTSLTVQKEWANDSEDIRPESVKAQLYQDGVPYGEAVTLNTDNNWQYTWENLPSNHQWTVRETDVPENYTSTQERSGTVITITNTYTPPEEPGPGPDPDPDPDPTPGPGPDPGRRPNPPSTPTPTPPPVVDIPQEDVPLTDVPEEDVPLSNLPEEEQEEVVEVPEEAVPLDSAPETGDNSVMWLLAALLSAFGLAVLAPKKRKEENG